MAKAKNTGSDVAVVERASVPAVVATNLPSYLTNFSGPTGTEDIDSTDITIPRLKIGQDMNPEVQNGDVERGDLFLNISGETIVEAGKQLPFVLLARTKEFILWRPKKDNNGGILARARKVMTPDGARYAWDKPNTTFDVKVEGVVPVKWTTKTYIEDDGLDQWGSEIPGDKDSKIAATAHHNYIVALPTHDDLIVALSLSRTASGRARDFNGMLKMGKGPLQARLYTVETEDDNRGSNKFKNYKFKNAGFVDEAVFTRFARIAEGFKGREIVVDQTNGDDSVQHDERA